MPIFNTVIHGKANGLLNAIKDLVKNQLELAMVKVQTALSKPSLSLDVPISADF